MIPGDLLGLDALNADSAALASAASAAEEALQLEREALSVVREGWSGDAAAAAADFIDAHCREGDAVVAALRHAAEVLAALGESLGDASLDDLPFGDSPVAAEERAQAGLADRTPANFASPVPQAAPPPASPMNWPAIPMPALPDLGGAISTLVAAAVDAFGDDPAVQGDDPVAETTVAETTAAETTAADTAVAEPVVAEPVVMPAAPISPESGAPAPLLAAEMPTEAPREMPTDMANPEPSPAAAAPPAMDRTPCEIAADELPQVGQ